MHSATVHCKCAAVRPLRSIQSSKKKVYIEHYLFIHYTLKYCFFLELRSGECKVCVASSSPTLRALNIIFSFVTTKIYIPDTTCIRAHQLLYIPLHTKNQNGLGSLPDLNAA